MKCIGLNKGIGILFLGISCILTVSADGQYGGGTGEPEDPYLIYDPNQMNEIGLHSEHWGKYFRLMNDIDLGSYSGTQFNIIGNHTDEFTGCFNGNNHTIRNFHYSASNASYVGIFGYVYNSIIKDVYIEDPNIAVNSGNYIGALVGYLDQGTTVKNCHVHNCNIKTGFDGGISQYVGGLAGVSMSTFIGCSASGILSATNYCGGIAGSHPMGQIYGSHTTVDVTGQNKIGGLAGNCVNADHCFSQGTVSGVSEVGGLLGNGYAKQSYSSVSVVGETEVGGLVGSGHALNSYAVGHVLGSTNVGGLIGENHGDTYNSYSTGVVEGQEYVGGLIGHNEDWGSDKGYVFQSYWDTEVSGSSTSDAGEGKTTNQMMSVETYVGWGNDCIWTINESMDYPRLKWENMPGQSLIAPAYGGGTGTSDDPFLIYTAQHLDLIGQNQADWDKHFKMMDNIDMHDLGDMEFHIIGFYNGTYETNKAFTGSFDGNGYTISNLDLRNQRDYVGIFGWAQNAEFKNITLYAPNIDVNATFVGTLVGNISNGLIENCTVLNGNIKGNAYVGGLIGNISSGTIRNCHVVVIVNGDGYYVGGLVGKNSNTAQPVGIIDNCVVEGSVSGAQNYVGGLVAEGGIVKNSYAKATVQGDQAIGGLVGFARNSIISSYFQGSVLGVKNVGGLVGTVPSDSNFIIKDCYASGTVTGDSQVGGLAGYVGAKIMFCYSTCSVTGLESTGGLIGYNNNANVVYSYWDVDTSGIASSSGGEGRTTIEMQQASTYAGWICSGLWRIQDAVDYPHLWWEQTDGEELTTNGEWAGCGAPDNPYLIFTDTDFHCVGLHSEYWDCHFKLMADIDLSAYQNEAYHVIGTAEKPFTGGFDGDNHAISGFHYSTTGGDNIGLFGYVLGSEASIRNVQMIDPSVAAENSNVVGALLGYLELGTIENCYIQNTLVLGNNKVGGLLGYVVRGNISHSSTSGEISGQDYTGGLIGAGGYSTISQSFSLCNVTGNIIVGGLIGSWGENIDNCYARGNVIGNITVGGLAGYNPGYIQYCFSTGKVLGNKNVGGLVGNNSQSIIYSFWDIETSQTMISGGGIGKTTTEMMAPYLYTKWFSEKCWVLDSYSDYPHLAWENTPGVLLGTESYGGGSGVPEDPYLLTTQDQLLSLVYNSEDWNKHFKLMADIDLAQYTWNPDHMIGYDREYNVVSGFSGVFDGNGHTISNLSIIANMGSWAGLFGKMTGENAEIRNLHLHSPTVIALNASTSAGCLVGQVEHGKVLNCTATNVTVSAKDNVGGLVGKNSGLMEHCLVTGSVLGKQYVGGLIGDNYGDISSCAFEGNVGGTQYVGGMLGRSSASSSISGCYAMSSVSNQGYYTGGLIGTVSGDCKISSCYATGSVSSQGYYAGGLIGSTLSTCQIFNTYAANTVVATSYVGGLVGKNSSSSGGNVFASYWDVDVSGLTISAGGIGLYTAEMQNSLTYVGWLGEFWKIDENSSYPNLSWQGTPGQPIEVVPFSGTGTAEDPYRITNVNELQLLGSLPSYWDRHYRLESNIDLNELGTTPYNIIGRSAILPFSGVFDGNGHTISNLHNAVTNTYVGIFGYASGNLAGIKNVIISAANMTNSGVVTGCLVGYLAEGSVDNCCSLGGRISPNSAGGLVGICDYGIIQNCHSSTEIHASDASYAGGLVGKNSNGLIENCYATGIVYLGWGTGGGGLVGDNGTNGRIKRCYSTSKIDGYFADCLGGLVGVNGGLIETSYAQGTVDGYECTSLGGCVGGNSSNGTVLHSYSTGRILGSNSSVFGGLIASNSGKVIGCVWDKNTSVKSYSAGGLPLTTAQMKTIDSFNNIGWGVTPVWYINSGLDYPRLEWQNMGGQLIQQNYFTYGTGTEADPFQIYTVEEFNRIGTLPVMWDKYFALMNDLDLSSLSVANYNLIGKDLSSPFQGVFEGNGHVLTGLNYITQRKENIGLFGYMHGDNAQIKNLNVDNCHISVTEGTNVGSLVGSLQKGIISNSRVTNTLVEGQTNVGSLCGKSVYQGTVLSCRVSNTQIVANENVGGLVGYNNGNVESCAGMEITVNGTTYVGGISGYSTNSSILKCSVNAKVTGSEYVGGITGYGMTIEKCSSAGTVTGKINVGGIAGKCSSIHSCYSLANITGINLVGVLAGSFLSNGGIYDSYAATPISGEYRVWVLYSSYYQGGASNSYWDIEVCNYIDSESLSAARTTQEMMQRDTYDGSSWNFVGDSNEGEDTWSICEGMSYPKFVWQIPQGDFACPDGVGMEDLMLLAQEWLVEGTSNADIAPAPDGDGAVDLLDFAILSQNWLMDVDY